MPACKVCKRRIDLSVTGVRAYKCSECGKGVCRDHFDFAREICHGCAGLPVTSGRVPFSFVRKPSDDRGKR